jgi:Tol biopolymer transport system component
MRRAALLLSAIVLVGAVAAIVVPALATTPGKDGLIAFTRYRLQNSPLRSEIFVAKPDGTGLKRVSHSARPVEDDQAHWSPDGAWIVFDRCTSSGPCSVWLVRPDGSGQRLLSAGCPSGRLPPVCVDDSNPAFTPDGRHVVFQHEFGRIKHGRLGDSIEHSQIVRIDLNGMHLTVLRRLDGYRGDLEAPRVSPDGTHLLFRRYNSDGARPAGGEAIFVASLDGSDLRRVTPWRLAAAGADWSPDSTHILFKSTLPSGELTPGTNLYTMRADGTGLERLTNVGAGHYVLSGSYSPDGQSVVFATDEGATANAQGNTFADIVTRRVDAGKLTYVTHAANLDGWPTWGTAP